MVWARWCGADGVGAMVWARWCGPDGVDPMVWARWCGPDGVGPMVWARWCGPDGVGPVVWHDGVGPVVGPGGVGPTIPNKGAHTIPPRYPSNVPVVWHDGVGPVLWARWCGPDSVVPMVWGEIVMRAIDWIAAIRKHSLYSAKSIERLKRIGFLELIYDVCTIQLVMSINCREWWLIIKLIR